MEYINKIKYIDQYKCLIALGLYFRLGMYK